MKEQEFDLSIRADGYDAEQLRKISVVGAREEEIIGRLQSPAPLLLEGIRGTGKTTLLKLALERTNQEQNVQGDIAVYVSFSRYLLLENPSIPAGPNHPFSFWVSAKLLSAVYDTAKSVTGRSPNVEKIAPLLEVRFETVIGGLESTHKLPNNEATEFGYLSQPVRDVLLSFQNPDHLKAAILQILAAFGLRSVNLLCDEAAQYFKPEFQPLFFGILKSVHSPQIFFKAAIYPTVTYFGADFELGHDASIVPLTRSCLASDWIAFCRDITERREKESQKGLWETFPVFLESLAYSAFGIPRRFIELVGSLELKSATEIDLLNAIKSHAQRELLQPFDALKARIPMLVKDVELASYLLHLFLDDLKNENINRTYRTAYVAVSKHRALPFAIRKACNLLVYLGILERQAPCKLGHTRETADRLLVNPALIFSENLLADATKRRLSLKETIERIRQLELDRFKEYSRNSKALQEAVEESRTVQSKPCPRCGTELPFEARFCTNCGAAQTQTTVLTQIIRLPSSELDLTPGIKAKVVERFPTVGGVLEASDAELDALPYVGTTRVAIIRHAVDEIIAG